MNHRTVLAILGTALAAVFVLSDAAPTRKGSLVKFYPISRAQYKAILGLTEGQPAVSQARLVSGAFPSFSELRTAIANDITAGWQQLLNATGVEVYYEPDDNRVEARPLCVIKTVDLEEVDDDGGNGGNGHRYANDDYKGRNAREATGVEAAKKDETSSAEGRSGNYDDVTGNLPYVSDEDNDRPVINCVVVMRPKQPASSNHDDSHEHNQTHKRRRGHNNRRRHGNRRRGYQGKNNPVYAEFVHNQKATLDEADKKSTATASGHRARARDNSDDYYEQLNPFYTHQQPYGGGYPYNPYYNPYASGHPYGYPPYGHAGHRKRHSSEEEDGYNR